MGNVTIQALTLSKPSSLYYNRVLTLQIILNYVVAQLCKISERINNGIGIAFENLHCVSYLRFIKLC